MMKKMISLVITLILIAALITVCYAAGKGTDEQYKLIVEEADNVISVKKNGAKGDGKTDDTAAIQAAIDAAAGKDAVVYFPAGQYVTGNLTFPENVGLGFSAAANLVISKDAVVTVNSKKTYFPNSQIFAGEGSVGYMPNAEEVYPEWFGVTVTSASSAVQKAINAGDRVVFTRDLYKFDSGIELPQGRNIVLEGCGSRSTDLQFEGALNFVVFNYKYTEGKPTTIEMKNFDMNDAMASKTVVINYEGNPADPSGYVKVESCYTARLGFMAKIKYATGCSFNEMRLEGGEYSFYFGEGVNDITINRVLTVGSNEGMLVAEGLTNGANAKNLLVKNSSAVSCKGIDFHIKNYDNVQFIHASGDLGHGTTNRASALLENVNGFEFIRCWWASNAGGATNWANGYAEIRSGIELIDCTDGYIGGNSIVNHYNGVKVVNTNDSITADKPIRIEGNSFQANHQADVHLVNAKYVEIANNYMYSTSQYDVYIKEEYRYPGGNFNIYVDGSVSGCKAYQNVYTTLRRQDDAITGVNGLVVEDNIN